MSNSTENQDDIKNDIINKNSTRSVHHKDTYIFKIILIGDSSTGKTSLIQRFVNKTFDDKYLNTIGVDFFMKTVSLNTHQIKLQIWDTAGTEKYRSISSSYYRGSHAAFIVFDVTNHQSFMNVQIWMESFSKSCNPEHKKNVFLIGNKTDLIEARVVKQDEAEEFAKSNNLAYWETSAKSGENVEEPFKYIAQYLFDNYSKENIGGENHMRRDNEAFANLFEPQEKSSCSC